MKKNNGQLYKKKLIYIFFIVKFNKISLNIIIKIPAVKIIIFKIK